MFYAIKLSHAELEALLWASERGYFPAEVLTEMTESDSDFDTWIIPENAAWSLTEASEDEGFLTCLSSPLVRKIWDLIDRIV